MDIPCIVVLLFVMFFDLVFWIAYGYSTKGPSQSRILGPIAAGLGPDLLISGIAFVIGSALGWFLFFAVGCAVSGGITTETGRGFFVASVFGAIWQAISAVCGYNAGRPLARMIRSSTRRMVAPAVATAAALISVLFPPVDRTLAPEVTGIILTSVQLILSVGILLIAALHPASSEAQSAT